MFTKPIRAVFLFSALILLASSAQAQLYDRGGGMVYDSDQNITWIKDVDLSKTLGDDEDGRMTWQEAKDWADNLVYRSYDDWRLPKFRDELTLKPGCDSYSGLTYDNSDCGSNTNTAYSELAYMFHNILGNISMRDRNGVYGQCPSGGNYCLQNQTADGVTFDNLDSVNSFWTDTYVPSINKVIWFGYTYGMQADAGYADGIANVWVVRDGDSSIADPVFDFIDVIDAPLNTYMPSNTVTLTGIHRQLPISVTSGYYKINDGQWTAMPGFVGENDTVTLSILSAPVMSTTTSTTVTIGNVSEVVNVTTVGPDLTPDPFFLNDVLNAEVSTNYNSNVITVKGIDAPAEISVVGGEYAVNGGAWTSAPSTVVAGDTFIVRRTSSDQYSTLVSAVLTVGTYSDSFDITTKEFVPDTTPDPFTLNSITNAERSTSYLSNTITVTGINTTASALVVPTNNAQAEYSINGGPWVTGYQDVVEGDMIQLRGISGPDWGDTVFATLSIGGESSTFYIFNRQPVTTVDAFNLVDVTDAELSTYYETNAITVSGPEVPVNITINNGGEYRINSGAWTTAAGTVEAGDIVTVRNLSSENFLTSNSTLLMIGSASDAFLITTRAAINNVDPFSFVDVTDAELSTLYTSNTITVTGPEVGAGLTVVGGEFSINGGAWQVAYSQVHDTVTEGDTITVRRNSSANFGTTVSVEVTIGTQTDSFDITTKAIDDTPDPLIFNTVFDAEIYTLYTSNSVTITGINTSVPIIIASSVCEYSINGGTWTNVTGTVENDDVVAVRRTSSSQYETDVSCTLRVGGDDAAIGIFHVITKAPDITPNPFSFVDVTDAELDTSYTSNAVTITGIDAGTSVSAVFGEYRVNGGAWTSVVGTVAEGDVVEVRRNSSTQFSTAVAVTLTVGTFSDAFDITTKAEDITPNAFSFIDVTDAELETSYSSNAVTITGINTATAVSIVGGEYRVNGGAWASTAGTVVDGDVVEVRRNSSTTHSTQVSATLTVGTFSDAFDITTIAADITPNAFSFIDVTNAEVDTSYTSNTVTITGINTATAVSIVGGEYRVNSGAWTSFDGTVVEGDVVEVRRNSSTQFSTAVAATLTVGTYSDAFDITTIAADITPEPFSFIDVTDAQVDTSYTSNTVTITGINTTTAISIVGGEYRVNGGSWTSAAGTVLDGDVVEVRRNSSTQFSTSVAATLIVGTYSDAFDITTIAADITPNAFSLIDVFDAELNTSYVSNVVTITGINTEADVSIVGGEYRINGGAWTSSVGVALNGDVIEVRRNSSTEYVTAVSAVLTVGTVSDAFDITTVAYIPGVDPFTFIDILNAELDISYISNTITVSGIEASVEVSIVDGEYSINRGAWTSDVGTVVAGDMIEVRKTSSTAYETTVSTILTVGTQSDSFDVTTRGIDDPVDPQSCVDPGSYKKLPPGQIVRRVKDPKIDDLSFNFVITDQWTTGYCATVNVVNNGNSSHHYPYGVIFTLPEDTQFRYGVDGPETWNGDAIREGDKVTVIYPDWQSRIGAGATDTSPFGYCVEGHSEPTNFEHYVPSFEEVAVLFEVTNQWMSGFCGQFKARYSGNKSYSVTPDRFNFRLPEGSVITESWNGDFVQEGELVSVDSADWISHLTPEQEATIYGFCATGKKLPCNYGTEIENQYTVTFQNGLDGYNGAQDSWVASGVPTSNFGGDRTMEADGDAALNSSGYGEGVALMQWDVSSIPADAIITSAEITVEVTDAAWDLYGLYAMNGGWTEDTVTWNSASIDANQGKLLAAWEPSGAGYHTIKLNFTGVDLVQSWLQGGNGGLMIRSMGTTDGVVINTSEQRKRAHRPSFKVTYRVEEQAAAIAAFSFSDVVDAELGQLYTSNSVTLSGTGIGVEASVTGGEYRVNGGVWTDQVQTVSAGDSVEVRAISAAEYGASVSAILTVDGVSDSFDITTKAAPVGQACSVSYQAPTSAEQAAAIQASLAGIEYSLNITSSSRREYCAQLVVTNTSNEAKAYPYGVQFDLPNKAKITGTWDADVQLNGNTVTAIFPAGAADIPANSQAPANGSFSFCVMGGSEPNTLNHYVPDFTQVDLTFSLLDQWSGGYCGSFQASYNGNDAYIPAPNAIGFTLDQSVAITDAWTGSYTRDGSNVTFTLPSWLSHINQGGSIDIETGICVVGELLPCHIESK